MLQAVLRARCPLTVAASAPNDVATFKNDRSRSGQNLAETTLTLANVNSASFGLLRTVMVDGKVDAQPLYLSQVPMSGKAHNVAFVATETVQSMPSTRTRARLSGRYRLSRPAKPLATITAVVRCPPNRRYLDAGHRSDRRPPTRAVYRRDVDRQVFRLSLTSARTRYHHGGESCLVVRQNHRQCFQRRGNVDFRRLSVQRAGRAPACQWTDLYHLELALRHRFPTVVGSSPSIR